MASSDPNHLHTNLEQLVPGNQMGPNAGWDLLTLGPAWMDQGIPQHSTAGDASLQNANLNPWSSTPLSDWNLLPAEESETIQGMPIPVATEDNEWDSWLPFSSGGSGMAAAQNTNNNSPKGLNLSTNMQTQQPTKPTNNQSK